MDFSHYCCSLIFWMVDKCPYEIVCGWSERPYKKIASKCGKVDIMRFDKLRKQWVFVFQTGLSWSCILCVQGVLNSAIRLCNFECFRVIWANREPRSIRSDSYSCKLCCRAARAPSVSGLCHCQSPSRDSSAVFKQIYFQQISRRQRMLSVCYLFIFFYLTWKFFVQSTSCFHRPCCQIRMVLFSALSLL